MVASQNKFISGIPETTFSVLEVYTVSLKNEEIFEYILNLKKKEQGEETIFSVLEVYTVSLNNEETFEYILSLKKKEQREETTFSVLEV
ncbi:hypothetical protein FRX31_019047 [Thalictrum thalictroides]|uniref:Uncharacterized protein n=1 Tax=Thalictrum thalictroides TaxID=46969 RepID=A0A7J6W1W0_THATH|nr:hypothetical protein FRX31_019047 [Thalictrum thalictroides]